MNIAIIGAGISGLTIGRLLNQKANITIFESSSRPGGLIKCDIVEGNLFHTCGGHVFNTKRNDVLDFFWSLFNKESEFSKTDRNSVVMFDNNLVVPYPIENHSYLFDDNILNEIISDLINTNHGNSFEYNNFEEFLVGKFGRTLYELYFKPYNKKIWRRDLSNVPISWLEGKLPMPSVNEIIFNNIRRIKEKKFVHSSFYYEKMSGSQFIVNRMAEDLNIKYNCNIKRIDRNNNKWEINGEVFDRVFFSGNIKQLPSLIDLPDNYSKEIYELEFHGTTSVFCELERNPYSWIYLPSDSYDAHRIICTGNFSSLNNVNGILTGTVEFTDEISEDDIKRQLKKIPLVKRYITHMYNKYTYPIQNHKTRQLIYNLNKYLNKKNLILSGRFAEWEYYNMDAAIGASMDKLCQIGLL